eukprot:TCONS_00037397-protein
MICYTTPDQYLKGNQTTLFYTSAKTTSQVMDATQEEISTLIWIISGVLIREDSKDKKKMADKVKCVNLVIGKCCEKYNLHLISHENITSKMLSSKKLHLNGSGISCFAQHLKNFISNTC